MPDFEADYPDMVESADILFEDNGSGEFAFGCCTGHIGQTQPDGSLHGIVEHHHGDERSFIARKWTSSAAC